MRKHAVVAAILLIVVIVAAVMVVWLWRRGALPEPARLLPAADGYVYFDLRPLRRAGLLKTLPAVKLDPDYAQFVQETGIEFERDLDEGALAVHLPPDIAAGTAEQAPTRYSEVFTGRFDQGKLTAYLKKQSAAVERYRSVDIYDIALPGRTLRVAVLGPGMVAASNTDSPAVMQGMIDRQQALRPRSPELLERYYRNVPLASVGWAVTQARPPAGQGNSVVTLPGGYNLFLPGETVIVGAIRYVGSVQLVVDAYTKNQEQAQRVRDQLGALVAVLRAAETAQAAHDPETKAFFESIRVEQKNERTELTATVPPAMLKKLVAEPPGLPAAAPAQPPPEKKPPRARPRRNK